MQGTFLLPLFWGSLVLGRFVRTADGRKLRKVRERTRFRKFTDADTGCVVKEKIVVKLFCFASPEDGKKKYCTAPNFLQDILFRIHYSIEEIQSVLHGLDYSEASDRQKHRWKKKFGQWEIDAVKLIKEHFSLGQNKAWNLWIEFRNNCTFWLLVVAFVLWTKNPSDIFVLAPPSGRSSYGYEPRETRREEEKDAVKSTSRGKGG